MPSAKPVTGLLDPAASRLELADELDRLESAINQAAGARTPAELVAVLSREARYLAGAETVAVTAFGTDRRAAAEARDGRPINGSGPMFGSGGRPGEVLPAESSPTLAAAGATQAVQRLPLIDSGIVVGSMTVAYPDGRHDPRIERLALVRSLAAAAGPIVARLRDRIEPVPSAGGTFQTPPSDGVRAERMRIARELHDGLIQSLYGMGLLIRTQAERTDLPERGRQTMSRWVRRIDELIEEATRYVVGLEARGIGLADLGAGIDAIAEEAAAAGLEVSTEVNSTDDARLSSEVSREILIVAREAASNAIRHAQAHRLALHVELDPAADTVTLTVDDDGIGFEPARPPGGHGLDNMAARAAASKGSLDVLSRRGAGTRVRLQMPMQRFLADRPEDR
jgi:two-component system, NarL family, sensor kinase